MCRPAPFFSFGRKRFSPDCNLLVTLIAMLKTRGVNQPRGRPRDMPKTEPCFALART